MKAHFDIDPRSNIVRANFDPRISAVKALALDVDGVLTDGGIWWNSAGDEWKRFSFIDVMGVSRARSAGLLVTLISGEDSPLVDRFALKMGISDFTKNCKDKAAALRGFVARHGLSMTQVCFMGDDVNDLEAMALAGVSAAPADARHVVLQQAALVSRFPGGHGAVREIVETIISSQNQENVNG